MKQTRRRHKSEGQALDKPNYEHIKPPKVTKKTKTKQELENQEYVRILPPKMVKLFRKFVYPQNCSKFQNFYEHSKATWNNWFWTFKFVQLSRRNICEWVGIIFGIFDTYSKKNELNGRINLWLTNDWLTNPIERFRKNSNVQTFNFLQLIFVSNLPSGVFDLVQMTSSIWLFDVIMTSLVSLRISLRITWFLCKF